MKKGFTVREKVLLAILGILVVGALYYYVFYIPTIEETTKYQQDNVLMEDQILTVQIQSAKMKQMEKELEEIKNGNMSVVPLPEYDNSRMIMNELHKTLETTMEYEVEFGKVETDEESNIVRRNVRIIYRADKYEIVKNVLERINNGQYRCVLKDISFSQVGGIYNAVVDITYFEYKE